jgi:L-arabinose transport system substrate-binding protein
MGLGKTCLVLAVLLLPFGCETETRVEKAPPNGRSAQGKIRIGFLVKMPDELWFLNEWKFAQTCADQYGFELIKIGIPDGEKTLAAIDNLAAQGAKGFVVCTPDVRLGPAIMAKANGYGMKVYSVDDQFVDANGKFMDVPYMGISARAIGEMVGKALYDEFKKRGWPIEETAACGITWEELNTSKERTDGTRAALIAARFPAEKIHCAGEKTTDVPGGFDAANSLLTQHPEAKRWLVFSMNDEGVLGAIRAMEGRGFNADTMIGISIGAGTGASEFEKEKPTGLHAMCLISPKRHGFETAESLYKWIKDGTPPPKDTRTVGILINRENFRQVMKEQGLRD